MKLSIASPDSKVKSKGRSHSHSQRLQRWAIVGDTVAQCSDHSLAVRKFPGSNIVRTSVVSQCHFNLTGVDGKEKYRTSSTVWQHTEI